ncbi:efflux RND transporter periplasmic adaptor subunit [Colwellia sp. MEBiC06753]
MPTNSKTLITLTLGAALGAIIAVTLTPSNPASEQQASNSDEKKPLYWVAPMDANYRRDKPGKSPMGMDLIPVYEEANSADEHGPGAVKIAPNVINNLGVRTAPVALKAMRTEINTVGYVQYDEDKLVHIHPRVDGWIEQLFIKAEGNKVKQGEPLYALYSPELVNAQKEMLIALNQESQHLVGAAKKRLLALQMSPKFIDSLIATKQVQQTVTFYAPQSGVVENLAVREGFYVGPGTTIMSIGQLDQVWVEAEVFERDAALITADLPVTMTLDYLPNKQWHGVVNYVYPTLNNETRTLRVRLKFDNPSYQLKPNMFAQISISSDADHNALVVPKEAVIRTGKQDRVVLALGEGQFKSIEVSVGQVGQEYIEIVSGLNEDDVVVTSAQFLIDSESSKNSDFKRMTADQTPNSVWLEGQVNSVMTDHRMANISHGPSDEWDWPEMTMDFIVADSVDINALSAGQSLHFEVTKSQDGGYQVTGIHIMSEPGPESDETMQVPSATVNGVINTIALESRVLNISRDAIEKWDRPAATMDFIAAEQIDLSQLQQGQAITFTFEVRDDLVIIDLKPADSKAENNAMPEMEHSQHMNH